MKYTFTRYLIYIFLLIILVLFLFLLRINDKIDNAVFVGGMVSLLTLFISTINYFQANDKFFKELFTEFNGRYDRMNNFLNSIGSDIVLSSEEKQRIVDYLNLCAEEYMWVKRGRIPEHIWRSWKNGIIAHMQNPVIAKVFEEEKRLWKSSYYGFFDEL